MKKTYIYIVCIIIMIVAIVVGKYFQYKSMRSEILDFNLQFEEYYEKEIYGTDIATLINKAVDNNEKNNVQKINFVHNDVTYYSYEPNDTNSINIDIKITDNDTTYKMESLYQGEITKFVQNYNYIKFKCTKIEYNKVGRVSYMVFEQVSE